MAWTPDPLNSTSAAMVRVGTSMGGVVAGSFWKEFQPDIMNLASSIFRKPPKAATKPPKKTGDIK
jgi:alpha-beta hydrolase superfamily lysophospholipase